MVIELLEINQVISLAGLEETVSGRFLVTEAPILIVAARHISNQFGESYLLELNDKCIFLPGRCIQIWRYKPRKLHVLRELVFLAVTENLQTQANSNI